MPSDTERPSRISESRDLTGEANQPQAEPHRARIRRCHRGLCGRLRPNAGSGGAHRGDGGAAPVAPSADGADGRNCGASADGGAPGAIGSGFHDGKALSPGSERAFEAEDRHISCASSRRVVCRSAIRDSERAAAGDADTHARTNDADSGVHAGTDGRSRAPARCDAACGLQPRRT